MRLNLSKDLKRKLRNENLRASLVDSFSLAMSFFFLKLIYSRFQLTKTCSKASRGYWIAVLTGFWNLQ